MQKRYIPGDDWVLGVWNTQLILRVKREPGSVPKLNICRQIGWWNVLVLRNNFLLSSWKTSGVLPSPPLIPPFPPQGWLLADCLSEINRNTWEPDKANGVWSGEDPLGTYATQYFFFHSMQGESLIQTGTDSKSHLPIHSFIYSSNLRRSAGPAPCLSRSRPESPGRPDGEWSCSSAFLWKEIPRTHTVFVPILNHLLFRQAKLSSATVSHLSRDMRTNKIFCTPQPIKNIFIVYVL